MTTCYFPCACESCQKVVQVNLLDPEPRCPSCGAADPIPYDDPRMGSAPGEGVVADWNIESELGRVLVLTDGTYRCPRCGEGNLRFADGGLCWD